jgi:hypothetical protein
MPLRHWFHRLPDTLTQGLQSMLLQQLVHMAGVGMVRNDI